MIERGDLHPLTLRFRDDSLEPPFQAEEGASGRVGYRIITGATVVLWAIAAVLLPIGTDVSSQLAVWVAATMAAVGLLCFAVSGWAATMDRQHALASLLTSGNGLAILYLAHVGDFVAGYAAAATILILLFGFVSRTRFVYAALRTAVIATGFGVVVVLYDGPGNLIVDMFIFVAAAATSLLGLRLLEGSRRRVWHQQKVIEEQTAAIEAERAESERLLLNVLPASVSARLKRGESTIADDFPEASVLFADLVGFTPKAAELTAVEVIEMLSEVFSAFDELVAERGLEKIKTIGDAYMVAGGLPEPQPDHAFLIVDLALEMLEATRATQHSPGLTARIGVHSGPVAGGVIGTRKFAYDIWGNTVNIASRLEQAGVPGRIHVSEATRALTDDVFVYEAREGTQLRGLGAVRTFLLVGRGDRGSRAGSLSGAGEPRAGEAHPT